MALLITGGAGFVGRNLLRVSREGSSQLIDGVLVIDKSKEALDRLGLGKNQVLCADLSQYSDWNGAFAGKDVVLSLAAQISSDSTSDFQRNNVKSIENTVRAMKENGVKRIIHFSSAAVLSARKDDYAKTKTEGEEIVVSSDLDYVILRPSMMYGPTDDKNIGYLINFSRKSPFFPIPGRGNWPRQPLFIDDVCRIVLQLMKNPSFSKRIIPLNGKEIINFDEMVRIVQKNTGHLKFRLYLPVPIFKVSMMAFQKMKGESRFTVDQVDSLTSMDMFEEYPWWSEFGVPSTTFSEGVRKMVESEG